MTDVRQGDGQYAYEGLDRTIHERARLAVLTSLIANPAGLAFNDLRRLCGLSDGNLSRHIQVLAEAGLVEVTKSFEQNKPQTRCQITETGRKRYLDYLAVLEQVVRDAASAVKAAPDALPAPPHASLPGLAPG